MREFKKDPERIKHQWPWVQPTDDVKRGITTLQRVE